MFEYTENNHFKFGFTEHNCWFTNRKSKAESWIVKFGECNREPKSLKDECIITAQKIYDSSDLIPNIMFSGGVDSEVVIQSFMQAKVPFNISILRFNDDLNLHDIAFAIHFCEKNDLKYDLIDINIINFWEQDLYDYAMKSQCYTHQLCVIMWLADQIDGLPIMGSLPIPDKMFKRRSKDYIHNTTPYELNQQWDLWMSEMILSIPRYFILQDRDAVPYFFQYTPEIVYAQLKEPLLKDLVDNKMIGKLSATSIKFDIYHSYFDILFRPSFEGFEKNIGPGQLVSITDEFEWFTFVTFNSLLDYSGICKFEYFDLLKQLKPNV